MFNTLISNAQVPYYSKFYYPLTGYDFDNHESYIIQRFIPTSNYNFEGTITIQTVSTSTNHAIQISLVDEAGEFEKGFTLFEGANEGEFVPTCAAYKIRTYEYCIAGIRHVDPNSSDFESWFLFLDRDLNVISEVNSGHDLSMYGIGPLKNLFVTDITSMEDVAYTSLGDFVYTGVGGNSVDPTPGSTGQTRMCIGYVNSSVGMGYGVTFDLTTWLAPDIENNEYLPARVIELPLGATDGGFMLCGKGPFGSLFFLRTDYHFGTTASSSGGNDIELYVPNNTTSSFYASDLYFDPVQNEVWFAGTTFGTNDDDLSFIYHKLVSLNTPGVSLFANLGAVQIPFNPPYFAKMIPWYSNRHLKISKIMPSDNADEAGIASNYYECNYYANYPLFNSYTFPMISKINYSDAALIDFDNTMTPTQSTILTTYPRPAGNASLGNYFNFLDYNHRDYPCHTAHQRTLPYYWAGFENYVMGQTTKDPINPGVTEYLALNGAVKVPWFSSDYHYNECSYRLESVTPDYVQANVLVPNISSDPSEFPINYPTINTDATEVDLNDCRTDNPFKQALDANNVTEFVFTGSTPILKCAEYATSYKIYNGLGALLTQGKVSNGYASPQVNSFTPGIYLLEVLNTQNQRMAIFKFVK